MPPSSAEKDWEMQVQHLQGCSCCVAGNQLALRGSGLQAEARHHHSSHSFRILCVLCLKVHHARECVLHLT